VIAARPADTPIGRRGPYRGTYFDSLPSYQVTCRGRKWSTPFMPSASFRSAYIIHWTQSHGLNYVLNLFGVIFDPIPISFSEVNMPRSLTTQSVHKTIVRLVNGGTRRNCLKMPMVLSRPHVTPQSPTKSQERSHVL
jgi:hypothetical protein